MNRFFLSFLACTLLIGIAQAKPKPDARFQVLLFLGEDCLISQYYTLPLRQMHERYACDDIRFLGIFPHLYSSSEKMEGFRKKYRIPFELQLDPAQTLMKRYGVRITPEVIVLDTQADRVLYRGRIDNTYFSLGKRRRVTTRHELKSVLETIASGLVTGLEPELPVGCIITPLQNDGGTIPMCNPTKDSLQKTRP